MNENNNGKPKVEQPKTKFVPKNLPYGVLVWETKEGHFLGDQDGNYLSIEATPLDMVDYDLKCKKMAEAAAYYGYPEGKVMFLAGRTQVSDSEYEDQMAALLAGEDIPGDIEA